MPLAEHCIPDDAFDIENNNNHDKFNEFQVTIQQARINEEQYLRALKGMIFLNEAAESKHLSQYRMTNVTILKYSNLNHTVKVKYDVSFMFFFSNRYQ